MEMQSRSATQVLNARFFDLERMCAEVQRWDLDFKPMIALPGAGEVGRVAQSIVGPLEIGHARFRAPLHQWVAPPAQRVTFIVMEADVHRLWWRGYDEDGSAVLIAPSHGEFESFSGADFHVHTISVAEDTLVAAAVAQELDPPKHGTWPEVVHRKPAEVEALRRFLRRLNGRTGDAHDASCVVNVLAMLWCSRSTPQRPRPAARMRDRAIHRCLSALSEHPGTPPSAGDLRLIAGVSERTLEYAFRERFGIGPAAFVKMQRLGRLRADLLRADPHTDHVGDLAAHHGFWHHGHLAADYSRAFGETPRQTLERPARAGAFAAMRHAPVA